jgi:DnaJ-class molecular chaperone
MAGLEEEMPMSTDTSAKAGSGAVNPGDIAPPGTPGTGEDICRECHGSGKLADKECPTCGGTGKVVAAIGGA